MRQQRHVEERLMMRWARRFCNRRVLGWTVFGLVLAGIAWTLETWLPAEPRWAVRGQFASGRILPDGSAFSHNTDSDLTLVVRDMHSGEPMGTFFKRHGGLLNWSYSPDGGFLAATLNHGRVRIAEVHGGEEWPAADCPQPSGYPVFLPDGEHFLVDSIDGTSRLVHTRTGTVAQPWPARWQFPKLSAAGNYIIFQSPEPNAAWKNAVRVHVWNISRQAAVAEIDNSQYLAMNADETLLFVRQHADAVAGYDRVIVWDMAAGRPRGKMRTVPSNDLTISLSPDGNRAAVVTARPDVVIAENREGKFNIDLWDLPAIEALAAGHLQFASVRQTAFSPDGRSFALLCGQQLAVFDVATGQQRWAAHDAHPPLAAFLFSADSQVLVEQTTEALQWRDTQTGAILETRFAGGQFVVPPGAAWKRDRLLVYQVPGWGDPRGPETWLRQQLRRWLPASWFGDDELQLGVYVFDARSRRVLFEHAGPWLRTAMFSDDGRTVLTIHEDAAEHLLRAWDVPAHKPLRWVLGVPLGLAALVLVVRGGWRRWRRRVPVAQGAAPCP
jgi:WD40 repeat protein